MPRNPDLVAQELAAHGCELPAENSNGLAYYLWPDEGIVAALCGRGVLSHVRGVRERYDEVLVALTTYRILSNAYGHTRRDSWESKLNWSSTIFSWLRVDDFYGWQDAEAGWVGTVAYHFDSAFQRGEWEHWQWSYSNTVIARDRFTDFINIGQRRLQEARSAFAPAYASHTVAIADQLERLVSLRQQGHVSEQEFEQAKRKLLYG